MKLSKYLQPIKTILWGTVGIIVSIYTVRNPVAPIKIFGELLFFLSLLMFILAIYQTLKVTN